MFFEPPGFLQIQGDRKTSESGFVKKEKASEKKMEDFDAALSASLVGGEQAVFHAAAMRASEATANREVSGRTASGEGEARVHGWRGLTCRNVREGASSLTFSAMSAASARVISSSGRALSFLAL